MNSVSYQDTVINFIVQAITAFFAVLGSIYVFFSYMAAATRLAGFRNTYEFIEELDPVILVLSLIVWTFTQLIMIIQVFKHRGQLSVNSENYDVTWLGTIFPAIAIFWFSAIFIFISIPAFVAGFVVNIFLSEEVALLVVISFTFAAAIWLYMSDKFKSQKPWKS